MPAVIYGAGTETLSIAVPQREFEKTYRAAGESTLVRLNIAEKAYNVLIHDTARDAVSGQVIHADFYAVRMDRALRARVPVEFAGEASAVKNEGGVLVKVAHDIEVEALPQDLPHGLRVDLSRLDVLGARIFIKDIAAPAGVRIISSGDDVVAIVEAPRSEEELAALDAPVAEVAAVETEAEAKKAAAEAKAKETEPETK
jgi:large subunit ribosomal protein L25